MVKAERDFSRAGSRLWYPTKLEQSTKGKIQCRRFAIKFTIMFYETFYVVAAFYISFSRKVVNILIYPDLKNTIYSNTIIL